MNGHDTYHQSPSNSGMTAVWGIFYHPKKGHLCTSKLWFTKHFEGYELIAAL